MWLEITQHIQHQNLIKKSFIKEPMVTTNTFDTDKNLIFFIKNIRGIHWKYKNFKKITIHWK